MNIVNKLTIRHLRENKRRTLVTIIGVIISVAMVTAVATLVVSFLDLLKMETIEDQGEWHVLYEDVNKEQLETIKNDEATQSVIISRDRGYAFLQGSQNKNKPYVFVKEYNNEGFEKFPIELSEGRLPNAENELLISEHIASNAKVEYKVGDSITLEVGQRYPSEGEWPLGQSDSLQLIDDIVDETLKNKSSRNYTIVGVIERPTWEPTWAPGYTVISYVDESMISKSDPANASVVLKKVKRSLYEHAENLAKNSNIEVVKFNDSLLRYYGVTDNEGLETTLFSLSAIIIAVIMVGSVALIYNAFAISVTERARHLGMLSSVGATKRQKRNSVFFEGFIIGIISIPLGIIAGLVGIGITFTFINSLIQNALDVSQKLNVVVTPISIIVACAISIITIFISTYLPARKASKISAIDAIRQTHDVKLTGKTVKTTKLVRNMFGIEAEFGLKNLKRNKRRYQVTVFSLVISIVLFLSVSYFTDSLTKSLELTQDSKNFDIQVFVNNEEPDVEEQVRRIVQMDEVTASSQAQEMYFMTAIEEDSVPTKLREQYLKQGIVVEDGKIPVNIVIHALDEQTLDAYTEKVGVAIEQLQNSSKLSGIVVDHITYHDTDSGKFVETKIIDTIVGQNLIISPHDTPMGENPVEKEIEIAALTDQVPMANFTNALNEINIVISQSILDELATEQTKAQLHRSFLYLKSSDPIKTQEKIEEMNDSFYVSNVYKYRQQDQQMLLIMSVFTYGFIALITAISVANIFNTISTSISLRKREFAMLRSVGMTPKGFNKMINYESIFYGIKSLLYGLPISIIVMYLIYKALMNSFSYSFTLPWFSILGVIIAIFVIVGIAMLYATKKIKRENIIETLKQENI